MRFVRRTALLAVLAALALAALAGTAGRASAAGAAPAAKTGRLVPFGSCGKLLGYAKSQASRLVGPWGLGGTVKAVGVPTPAAPSAAQADEAAPQQGVDYSGTNVQEAGVDEPDLVKTNGATLFAVANGRVNAVDVSTAKPRLLDTLTLDSGWSHELLLYGDRLLVLSRGGYWAEPLPAMPARLAPYSPAQSVLSEIDVSNPANLRLVRTLTLDGAYVAARLVGGTARIVVSSQVPGKLPYTQPQGSTKQALAAAAERNRSVVASSGVLSWLPSYRLARPGAAASKARPLVQCRNVRRPAAFSGLGMLTVLTVDLSKGLEPVDSLAVMTDARILYASQTSLYVATERWADRPDPAKPTEIQPGVTTAIHDFDISDPSKTRYRGSGSVPGFLLSQWSLSELDGVLRVVSTETPSWWGEGRESESFLTTLRERDGVLAQVGRVGGLGKGERVYAVRFVGDTAYVVTFRQVDPFYTLDLSDPAHPRVVGELKLAGYSSYLHPIGEDLIFGIGQQADVAGRPLGTSLSIFDVSDLRQPKLLYREALGQGWSEAETDHHAFLFWPPTGLIVVPFQQRAVGYRVGRARGIVAVGTVEHGPGRLEWTPPIRRALVVGSTVVTVSDAGVKSSTLDTLAELGWVSFPPPAARAPTPLGDRGS
jgi:uncharacterized secreted protein with C-terminal beta-propeller domain